MLVQWQFISQTSKLLEALKDQTFSSVCHEPIHDLASPAVVFRMVLTLSSLWGYVGRLIMIGTDLCDLPLLSWRDNRVKLLSGWVILISWFFLTRILNYLQWIERVVGAVHRQADLKRSLNRSTMIMYSVFFLCWETFILCYGQRYVAKILPVRVIPRLEHSSNELDVGFNVYISGNNASSCLWCFLQELQNDFANIALKYLDSQGNVMLGKGKQDDWNEILNMKRNHNFEPSCWWRTLSGEERITFSFLKSWYGTFRFFIDVLTLIL